MSNSNTVMEPAFVSVDLESSLGIIKDDDMNNTHLIITAHNKTGSTFVCQSTNTNQSSPVLDPSYETLPMMLMDNNQKVTRTSDTYPFANQQQQESKMEDDDDDEDDAMMDESDSPVEEEEDNNHNKKKKDKASLLSSSPQTGGGGGGIMSFEPIPVSDEAADLSMMMLLQDDEAKEVLVNRISDWTPSNNNHFQQSISSSSSSVPTTTTKHQNNDMNWVPIDLSDTEVDEEDEQSLLCMLEEEAKESGFVLENIGDRQSFWNNGGE